jgi:hypothetical protein
MNEKERSEEYYAQVAEHRALGDANESNAQGTIYPHPEPIEATGVFADTEERQPDQQPA